MSASIGYVYIMVNPAFDYLKIGVSVHHPLKRAKQLSASTSAPVLFTVAYHRRVAFPFQVEAEIHETLDEYRINDSREFFAVPLYEAITLLEEYPEVRENSAIDMKLPFAELFASFPDDGEGRELTEEEQRKCRVLERSLTRGNR